VGTDLGLALGCEGREAAGDVKYMQEEDLAAAERGGKASRGSGEGCESHRSLSLSWAPFSKQWPVGWLYFSFVY